MVGDDRDALYVCQSKKLPAPLTITIQTREGL
jgi:hypothetical protein